MENLKNLSVNFNALKRQKTELEKQIKETVNQISEQLTEDELNTFSYEELKEMKQNLNYLLPGEKQRLLDNVLEIKKVEKYPELNKPTYFPEIDSLKISDKEKLRLDKAAKNAIRYHISKENCKKLLDPLSIDDLELLVSVGIAERKYNFRCPSCYCSSKSISESDLNKYKRVWELEKKEKTATDAELDELDTLYEKGYYTIYIYCDDCDEEIEISSEEDLNKFKNLVDIYYKIIKTPDLKYDNL